MLQFRNAMSVLVVIASPVSVGAQEIRARVVDAASRQPIVGAHAALLSSGGDTVHTAITGHDGFFVILTQGVGRYELRIAASGYAPAGRAIEVLTDPVTMPAILLTPTPVVLDTVAVRVTSAEVEPTGVFGRSTFIVSGERMALLERQSNRVTTAIGEIPTLRVRYIAVYRLPDNRVIRNYTCIEGTRRMLRLPRTPGEPRPLCEPVVLILDGVRIDDPHETLKTMVLSEVESIEYVPPADAGQRYGLDAGASGALVVWSRGLGPHKSLARGGKR